MSSTGHTLLLGNNAIRQYAALSDVFKHSGGSWGLTNNNRSYNGSPGNGMICATVGKRTGKWYWELTVDIVGPTAAYQFGMLVDRSVVISAQTVLVQFINSFAYRGQSAVNCYGYWWTGMGAPLSTGLGCVSMAPASGITWSFAFDCSGGLGTWQIYREGLLASTVSNIPLTDDWYFTIQRKNGGGTTGTCNFGNAAFSTTPAIVSLRSGLVTAGYNMGLY